TALGTQEDVATPMEARFTGVEVQATVAQNLLDEAFIRRPAYAPFVEALLVLLAFPVAAAVLLAGVAPGALLAASLCGVMGWSSVWSFAAGIHVSPLLGTAGVALSWVGAVIVRLRGQRTRAVEGERQARRQALVAAAA